MDADIREVAPKLINNSNQLKKNYFIFWRHSKNFIKKNLTKKYNVRFHKVFLRRSKKFFIIKNFFLDKIVFQFQIKKKIIVKNFFFKQKKFQIKKNGYC